jgi:hypothetical protein
LPHRRPSAGIVTFSFYRERRDGSGTIERRIVMELVYDVPTAAAARPDRAFRN